MAGRPRGAAPCPGRRPHSGSIARSICRGPKGAPRQSPSCRIRHAPDPAAPACPRQGPGAAPLRRAFRPGTYRQPEPVVERLWPRSPALRSDPVRPWPHGAAPGLAQPVQAGGHARVQRPGVRALDRRDRLADLALRATAIPSAVQTLTGSQHRSAGPCHAARLTTGVLTAAMPAGSTWFRMSARVRMPRILSPSITTANCTLASRIWVSAS